MAIVNRSLDLSEQRVDAGLIISGTGVATTHAVYIAPHQCQLDAVRVYCGAATGTPVANLAVRRNLPAGATVLVNLVGTTLAVPAATGPFGFTLFSGASAFQLQAGDIVFANTDGVVNAHVKLVVRALQDIKTFFGV